MAGTCRSVSVGERIQFVLPKNWKISGISCPLREGLLLADVDGDGEIEMSVGFQDGHLAVYKSSVSGFHTTDDHKIYPYLQSSDLGTIASISIGDFKKDAESTAKDRLVLVLSLEGYLHIFHINPHLALSASDPNKISTKTSQEKDIHQEGEDLSASPIPKESESEQRGEEKEKEFSRTIHDDMDQHETPLDGGQDVRLASSDRFEEFFSSLPDPTEISPIASFKVAECPSTFCVIEEERDQDTSEQMVVIGTQNGWVSKYSLCSTSKKGAALQPTLSLVKSWHVGCAISSLTLYHSTPQTFLVAGFTGGYAILQNHSVGGSDCYLFNNENTSSDVLVTTLHSSHGSPPSSSYLCTTDCVTGTTNLFTFSDFLRTLDNRSSIFSQTAFDLTQDGNDELICCTHEGDAMIHDSSGSTVRFQFEEDICAFTAGLLSLRHTLYARFSESQVRIWNEPKPPESLIGLESLSFSEFVDRESRGKAPSDIFNRIQTVPVLAFATVRGKIYVVYNLELPFVSSSDWKMSSFEEPVREWVGCVNSSSQQPLESRSIRQILRQCLTVDHVALQNVISQLEEKKKMFESDRKK